MTVIPAHNHIQDNIIQFTNIPNNNDLPNQHIEQYQIQAGTPRTEPLGSRIIAIGFRPGILLTSTVQSN